MIRMKFKISGQDASKLEGTFTNIMELLKSGIVSGNMFDDDGNGAEWSIHNDDPRGYEVSNDSEEDDEEESEGRSGWNSWWP